jgi:glutathione S-transferase
MIFYDSPNPAPNPQRVRIFAAEKGIALPTKTVSLVAREQKSPEYLSVNPRGQTPALVLDDGTVITESVSICRYLEAIHPEPPLFGTGAVEQATVDMWARRVEMILMPPVGAVWVHVHPLTAKMPGRNPEWGATNQPRAIDALRFFDSALADRMFLASDRFTIADILLYTSIAFAAFVGIAIPDDMMALKNWYERVGARPSASA